VKELVVKHGARDTTQRKAALAEIETLTPRNSQHIRARKFPRSIGCIGSPRSIIIFGFGAYT